MLSPRFAVLLGLVLCSFAGLAWHKTIIAQPRLYLEVTIKKDVVARAAFLQTIWEEFFNQASKSSSFLGSYAEIYKVDYDYKSFKRSSQTYRDSLSYTWSIDDESVYLFKVVPPEA
jgi:hypothetical protein